MILFFIKLLEIFIFFLGIIFCFALYITNGIIFTSIFFTFIRFSGWDLNEVF